MRDYSVYVPIILGADKSAKCNWFGTGFSWLVYGFIYLTLFFVVGVLFHMKKLEVLRRVWFTVGVAVAISTLLFYSLCHKTMPRATVLG